jgi:hypothetical protein
MEKKQVYLVKYGFWSDVLSESDYEIIAIGIDGVTTFVAKDGTEQVRYVE